MALRLNKYLTAALLTTGCATPVVVELPEKPATEALEVATRHRQETSAPVRFEVSAEVRSLSLERNYGDAFHRYTIPIGASLESTLRALCDAAIQGPARRQRQGEPLRIRVVDAAADCALEGEVLVVIQVTLEAMVGARTLGRRILRAAGATTLEGVWSFDLPARIEEAFALALLKLHAQTIRFLEGLDLPLRRAQPKIAEPPTSEAEEPAAKMPSAPTHEPLDLTELDARLAIGDLAGAHESATELIKAQPSSATAFQRRGAVRLSMGNLDGALADCFRALELDPTLASAYVTRAHVYARRGDHARVRADCDAALQLPHGRIVKDGIHRLLAGLDGG